MTKRKRVAPPQQKIAVIKPAKVGNGKRVIFVLEASSLSGGVRVLYDQCLLLHKHGWSVSVFSLSPRPSWYTLPPGIQWEVFLDYQSLSSALLYEGPRVIKVATWWRTASATRDGCIGNEGKYFCQDIESSYSSMLDYQQLVMASYQLGLGVYSPSTLVRDWHKAQGLPCSYVGLWVKPRGEYDFVKRYVGYPGVVLAVARRQWLKGFQTLAEFWRKAEICIADLQLQTYSTEDGAKLGNRHIHHQNPPEPAVAKLFDTARLFVSASNQEGFCLPAAEAMLAGIPCAVTDAIGNRAFCVNEETCLMVPRGDANALLESSLRLLDDLPLCLKLSRNAHQVISEQFSYKVISPRVLDFFEKAHAEL